MAIEIERKYLVKGMDTIELPPGVRIRQGYLSAEPTVRVRVKGDHAFLTIKVAMTALVHTDAIQRQEFEYEIPVADAEAMLAACRSFLEKTRYILDGGIELDIFHGRHAGLILAEYESADGSQPKGVNGLEWEEVTNDKRYSNAWMCENGIPD